MMSLIALGGYMRPSALALLLAFVAMPSMAIAESSPFLKTISSLPPQWKQAKDWECLQRSGHFVQNTSALPVGRSEDFRRTGEYYLEARINIKDGYIFSQTHGGTDSLLMEENITEVSYARDYNYVYIIHEIGSGHIGMWTIDLSSGIAVNPAVRPYGQTILFYYQCSPSK
ncbi:hypothetical protein [Inquilinus sp. OTU3971]|uniref:hypothetical protein n=1 Tax=Inquilinus sp. OTU3971 TaxID=3043855 RepID=UPI00313C4346